MSRAFAWFTCSKLWPFTSKIWSPLFKPTSSAFDLLSTFEINIPKPLSNPPKMLKFRTSSLFGLANVTFRVLAFAAHAIFSNLKHSS